MRTVRAGPDYSSSPWAGQRKEETTIVGLHAGDDGAGGVDGSVCVRLCQVVVAGVCG